MTRTAMSRVFLLGSATVLLLGAGLALNNVEYAYDNGTMNVAVGPPSSFPSDPEMLWGNYFFVEEGGEVITRISFALGSSFPEGREVHVALFDDPDDDLDPRNAVFLTVATTIPKYIGGSQFNHVDIEPTQVSGGFFVAAFAWAEAGIDRPAAQDTAGPSGFSWLLYNPVEKGVNLENLDDNAFFENMTNIPGTFPGVWMIRATGKPIDETPCPGDLDESGTVDGSDLLMMLAAWGECDDPQDCSADLDGNGVVDGSDLLMLLANWGTCP
jgi:hypothetical protein